ncbi:MAG: hypothetical protein KDA84_26895, partial [Planctomycetaceae bacterium]|nr:hypothetical protein [Planctomycetaceae bacterium]
MPFLHGLPRLVCALGGLAMVGCYSPYRYAPYSPYGPGIPTYTPQMAPQPQFGPPVGSPTPVYQDGGIPPGGSFPPASGTFPPNDSFGGSQFNNSPGLTPTPDPNSSFPPSNNGGFSPTLPPDPGNGGFVPNYDDPNTLSPPPGNGTFENNVSPFQQDGAQFRSVPSTSESIGRVENIPVSPNGQLQLAAHQSPAVGPISVGMNSPALRAESHAPYGYDAVGYRWLTGIVDFDEQKREWVLIYDLTPDPQDRFRGQVTLIQTPYLNRLHSNDFIHVEGYVDNN